MAQRFGGKYSPNASAEPQGNAASAPPPASRFDGKKPSQVGAKVNLLFPLALAMLVPAFLGGPDALFLGLGASALMLLSAWLTREGVIAHQAFDERRIARKPAFPRKIFGALLMGAGLGVGAMISQPAFYPVAFGVAAAILHLVAFGPDPMRDKGAEGIDEFQTDRVARAVDEAEKMLAGMRDAILRASDRQLETRVDKFIETARAMFRAVEDDPRDLTAARKFLSVYLTGARDATVKFADFYAGTRDARARADYIGLLDDLETNFASRRQVLLSDSRSDMDIEISVLRERLQREG